MALKVKGKTATKKKTRTSIKNEPVDVLPSTPNPASPGQEKKSKRKSVVFDSDVEIIESPTTFTNKKIRVSGFPSPGTNAFKKLPAVSISAKLDAVLQSGNRSIAFGSTSDPEKDDKPSRSPANDESEVICKPKSTLSSTPEQPATASTRLRPRTKQKTEKALFLDDIRASRKARRPAIPIDMDPDSSDTPDLLPPSSPPADAGEVDDVIEWVNLSDEGSEKDALLPALVISEAKEVAGSASGAEASCSESVLDGENISHSDDASEHAYEKFDNAGSQPLPETVGSAEDDPLAIMRKDLQHPDLRRIYKGLPVLEHFCDVRPFSNDDGGTSPRAMFESLCKPKVLVESSFDLLLRGLVFEQSGCFVNMSRIHPGKLAVDGRRVKIAGSGENAVGIMLGLVTECFLVSEGTGGSALSPYPVHKISIAPFAQEMRRETSLWGQLLGFQVISGTVSGHGMTFSTRKKIPGSQYSSAPTTPKKGSISGLFMSVSSPLASGTTRPGVLGLSYPSSRRFDEKIPIYDGRLKLGAGFSFTDADFNNLSKLPIYDNGKSDLPEHAVVAVGYTLNTYVGEHTGALILSSNIQFAILLGLANAKMM